MTWRRLSATCAVLLFVIADIAFGQTWEGDGAMIRAQHDAQRIARRAWPEQIAVKSAADLLDGYAW
jgi:hypothetical protein